MLKRENDNRIEEISKLAKKVGCRGEVETDRETTQRQEVTNDSSSEEGRKNKHAQGNIRRTLTKFKIIKLDSSPKIKTRQLQTRSN